MASIVVYKPFQWILQSWGVSGENNRVEALPYNIDISLLDKINHESIFLNMNNDIVIVFERNVLSCINSNNYSVIDLSHKGKAYVNKSTERIMFITLNRNSMSAHVINTNEYINDKPSLLISSDYLPITDTLIIYLSDEAYNIMNNIDAYKMKYINNDSPRYNNNIISKTFVANEEAFSFDILLRCNKKDEIVMIEIISASYLINKIIEE